MQQTSDLDQAWHVTRLRKHFHETVTFTEDGIALGPGTLLLPIEKAAQGKALVFPGKEIRILALLSAAYKRPVATMAVLKILRASDLWNQGEKALAQIHLALLGLPRLDEPGAHRLFLADLALERGAPVQGVMKALGLDPASLDVEKYNPAQLRVPAGNGRESGRWGSGGGGARARATNLWPATRHVEAYLFGRPISDANPSNIIPGAHYAQVSPTPILTAESITKFSGLTG